MTTIRNEPAAFIGLAATIIVGALTTVAGSGLVHGGTLDLVNALVTIVPLIAGLVARRFVTPVAATASR